MLLQNIQFLRGAAAAAVVFFHMAPYFINSPHWLQNMHAFFMQFGYAGVDVFFVISGYVIWISTFGQRHRKTPAEFAYKRAARIYLGYWPYFLMISAIIWFFVPSKLSSVNLLGSFFLTELSIPDLVLQVAWTLSFELYFYLFFTVCLFFSMRSSKALLLLFAISILVVQAYAIINGVYAVNNLPEASALYTFFFSPFCLQFLAGVAVAIYFEKYRIKHLKSILLLGLAVFVFTLWYQSQQLPAGHTLMMGYYVPMRVILFGVVALALVASLIEIELRGRQLWPQFGRWFGDASYSLYLSHIPILFLFSQVGLMAWGSMGQWQHLLAVVIIIATIAIYSVVHYRLIEWPLMQWAKRKGQLLFHK